MVVTVVIPTRNRANSLARCLDAILADRSAAEREVVVVDNGSTDTTPLVARERGVRLVTEPRPGASLARNRGIDAARGDVILFTDDDVVVADGWTDALIAPLDDPSVGAVGGRVIATFPDGRPEWLTEDGVFQPMTLADFGRMPFRFGVEVPIGANMAMRAKLTVDHRFNTYLGHTGRLGYGYEDTELMHRIADQHIVLYAPDAVALHVLDAPRLTLDSARRVQLHHGAGMALYERLSGLPPRPFQRRVVRTWRAWQRLNDPMDVPQELRAWRELGTQLGWLLGRSRPVLDRTILRAARPVADVSRPQ